MDLPHRTALAVRGGGFQGGPGARQGVRPRAERGERPQVDHAPAARAAEVLEGLPRAEHRPNHLVPSPFSIEGGKIEAKGVSHTVLGGS